MGEVGVKAVVQELGKFLSDMGTINSAINNLRPSGTLLQQMFESVGDAAAGFGREILNIAEVALGVLLRDAINAVIGFLKDLIGEIIDAGAEFQTLQLRLERLNFNTLIDSGMEFNKAMAESVRITQEQIVWLQKLAALSPYDAQDIANTFTLARAYGMTADEAQRLTQNIIDFASGMGLGNTEMERIIINFGQLIQQNKLNAQDLRDLARGAFVPINDILERMAKNMGITVEELNKMRASGKLGGDAVKNFIEAFNELVEERFVGAAEKMSRTIQGATANFKDLFKSIIGFYVIKPLFDTIGGAIADFVNAVVSDKDRWDAITLAADKLGKSINYILQMIIARFVPSTTGLANTLVEAFQGVADWVNIHSDKIIQFFFNIGKAIGDVVTWVRASLIPIFERILIWIQNNRTTILTFFGTLLEIVGTVFKELLGGTIETGNQDVLGTILGTIKAFMEYVINNKDKIAEWVAIIIQVVFWVNVAMTIFNIFIGILGAVAGAVVSAIAFFVSLWGILSLIGVAIAAIGAPIVLIGVLVAGLFLLFLVNFGGIRDICEGLEKNIVSIFLNLWDRWVGIVEGILGAIILAFFNMYITLRDGIVSFVTEYVGFWYRLGRDVREAAIEMWDNIKSRAHDAYITIITMDWWGLGRNIIESFAIGISDTASLLIDALVGAALEAYYAALDALGIASPSRLFTEIGEMTMLGMAEGIRRYAGIATSAMTEAMASVAAPSFVLPSITQALAAGASGNSYQSSTTNEYNLNIQSSASREPIIQDFNMLRSLSG